MTFDEFNNFCRALSATTYVVQWGGSHVWKVGGKAFAIGGDDGGEAHHPNILPFAETMQVIVDGVEYVALDAALPAARMSISISPDLRNVAAQCT
jgi:predicted DNA-binding protein (MmcQ/YjbR family)